MYGGKIPTVKVGGSSNMVWGYFYENVTVNISVTGNRMNAAAYQNTLEENNDSC